MLNWREQLDISSCASAYEIHYLGCLQVFPQLRKFYTQSTTSKLYQEHSKDKHFNKAYIAASQDGVKISVGKTVLGKIAAATETSGDVMRLFIAWDKVAYFCVENAVDTRLFSIVEQYIPAVQPNKPNENVGSKSSISKQPPPPCFYVHAMLFCKPEGAIQMADILTYYFSTEYRKWRLDKTKHQTREYVGRLSTVHSSHDLQCLSDDRHSVLSSEPLAENIEMTVDGNSS